MKPDLIIFDFDGVLVDTQAIINEIEWDYLSQQGMQMTLKEFTRRFSGVKVPTIIEQLKTEHNIRFLKNPQHATKEVDEELLTKLSNKKVEPLEGIKDVLENLHFKKCIASNCSLIILRPLLAASGLDRYFDSHVFSADMVERPKPYPDLFLYAACSMGARPAQCLVIEDSEAGIQAATAAGMKVWGFLGGTHATPDTTDRLLAKGAERTLWRIGELLTLIQ